MESCTRKAAFLLSFYFRGELGFKEELIVIYHLRYCETCRADLKAWKELKAKQAQTNKIA